MDNQNAHPSVSPLILLSLHPSIHPSSFIPYNGPIAHFSFYIQPSFNCSAQNFVLMRAKQLTELQKKNQNGNREIHGHFCSLRIEFLSDFERFQKASYNRTVRISLNILLSSSKYLCSGSVYLIRPVVICISFIRSVD